MTGDDNTRVYDLDRAVQNNREALEKIRLQMKNSKIETKDKSCPAAGKDDDSDSSTKKWAV